MAGPTFDRGPFSLLGVENKRRARHRVDDDGPRGVFFFFFFSVCFLMTHCCCKLRLFVSISRPNGVPVSRRERFPRRPQTAARPDSVRPSHPYVVGCARGSHSNDDSFFFFFLITSTYISPDIFHRESSGNKSTAARPHKSEAHQKVFFFFFFSCRRFK